MVKQVTVVKDDGMKDMLIISAKFKKDLSKWAEGSEKRIMQKNFLTFREL